MFEIVFPKDLLNVMIFSNLNFTIYLYRMFKFCLQMRIIFRKYYSALIWYEINMNDTNKKPSIQIQVKQILTYLTIIFSYNS